MEEGLVELKRLLELDSELPYTLNKLEKNGGSFEFFFCGGEMVSNSVLKLVAKGAKFFFDEDLEPSNGPIEGIKHDLAESRENWGAVPPVAAVYNHRCPVFECLGHSFRSFEEEAGVDEPSSTFDVLGRDRGVGVMIFEDEVAESVVVLPRTVCAFCIFWLVWLVG